MKICNYCNKEIKEHIPSNVEVSIWEDEKDGNCKDSDILISEVHYKCAKEIVKRILKEPKKNKRGGKRE
jgi:hypothetical protein